MHSGDAPLLDAFLGLLFGNRGIQSLITGFFSWYLSRMSNKPDTVVARSGNSTTPASLQDVAVRWKHSCVKE